MAKRIKAFLHGALEFRAGCTTHYPEPLICDYDAGREWAHRITLRHWDDCAP